MNGPRPNTRLKLAARGDHGMNLSSARRSLRPKISHFVPPLRDGEGVRG